MKSLPDFLHLERHQLEQLTMLEHEVKRLNARLNLVSAASTSHFWERHVVHSLTLAARPFPTGAMVVDWGTGGGFPGLPLAIAFPHVTFHLVDAIGKKIQAVRTVARRLGLDNVVATQARAEAWDGTTHYAVSRATAPLADLWRWTERVRVPHQPVAPDTWAPGLLALKGGDLREEMAALADTDPHARFEVTELGPIIGATFADKVLVHVQGRF